MQSLAPVPRLFVQIDHHVDCYHRVCKEQDNQKSKICLQVRVRGGGMIDPKTQLSGQTTSSSQSQSAPSNPKHAVSQIFLSHQEIRNDNIVRDLARQKHTAFTSKTINGGPFQVKYYSSGQSPSCLLNKSSACYEGAFLNWHTNTFGLPFRLPEMLM